MIVWKGNEAKMSLGYCGQGILLVEDEFKDLSDGLIEIDKAALVELIVHTKIKRQPGKK